jgi:NAD(P)-dependent dehydrogenase (short-subunit alcohol dehydrogenase family)
MPVACNVGDWAQCDALAQRLGDECGHVDILVNDAGMCPRYGSLDEVSRELFDKVIAVNLAGPFRCVR